MEKPKLICVVGPTASGKTRLAIALCQALNGEVISCDSMQIYRGMDIGTAKPTPEEREAAAHHMIDIASPEEDYSVARYAREAAQAVSGVLNRGRIPVVAGGTGLYLDALTGGMRFARREEDATLRRQLEQRSSGQLMEQLRACDPASAERLHPADRKRIIRALEVYFVTGKTISAHHEETKNLERPYRLLKLGLCCTPRQILYHRIEQRVDQMIAAGWLEETRRLREKALSATALQAIGYQQMSQVLDGTLSMDGAADAIKQGTRRYAKRQLSWFRRDPETVWLDIGVDSWQEIQDRAIHTAKRFLQEETRKGAPA